MFLAEEKEQAIHTPVAVKRSKRNWFRALALIAAAVVLVAGTLAVRKWMERKIMPQEQRMDAYMASYGMPEAVSMMDKSANMPRDAEAKAKINKIIRTFALTLSTKQFDQDLAAIRAALEIHQGYVEESTLSSDYGARRTAYMRVRVPKDKVDAFVSAVKGVGRALDVRETAEDVSEQYTDIQLRLDTQKAKLHRLQEMLKQAVSVEELLKIEASIAETQYQVDSLTGSLRGMDSKVDYSTVTIDLREEKQQDTAQAKEETLGERMKSAFGAMLNGMKAFAEDVLVFLVAALPLILLMVVLIVITKVIYKKRRKK